MLEGGRIWKLILFPLICDCWFVLFMAPNNLLKIFKNKLLLIQLMQVIRQTIFDSLLD